MYKLISEKVDFQISCTDIELIYTETKSKVNVEGQTLKQYLDGETYSNIKIIFEKVAEVKCTTLNFYEFNYNEFEILKDDYDIEKVEYWKINNHNPDSGFYRVENSEWLQTKYKLYDPTGNLNLKHYLIIGYDSYIEILASRYNYMYE
ncbi:hypothetical protein B0A78_03905 [Flavobacterium columnare NBRC 100251 = ATCC 23463]|uniref:hypothetical protein n=1 Tax=Flavobacterium TaxID=237 RepID=UPI000BE8CCD9|nr:MULTISPECIES: hypothetical protein [Flavobacterium]PDS25696.1 hypothetical protein B0A78_03905 [Flavobacterium columnare NBRC 100251 = ATCC 23463]QYS91886.1 hypothetical protein JJC04_04255 [Flavobacterium covae]GEM59300.1 hypothetical protein FC1_25380 [Flavobacterium columnare NBRC 100251 = ATCC 23463]